MDRLAGYFNITGSKPLDAIILFLAFALIAKLADILISRFLKKLTRYTQSDIDDKIIDILHKPIYYTLVLFGAVEALSYLVSSPKILFYGNGIIHTLIVLVLASAFIKLCKLLTENAFAKIADITGLGKDVVPFIEKIWKLIIVAASLIFILSIWRINITPVLASAGIAGVAVALAAKDTLSNFFGGISIFFDRPYKVGDIILIDNHRGEVVEIGIRSTRIKTLDDVLISMPNSIIANSKIINESAPSPKIRLTIPVSVSYGSDIDKVFELLKRLASVNTDISEEPAPKAVFKAFGESSLNIELFCWIEDTQQKVSVTHSLNCAIYNEFANSGIKIPYPQRDVHIYNEPGNG